MGITLPYCWLFTMCVMSEILLNTYTLSHWVWLISPLHHYNISPLHHSIYICYWVLPLTGSTVPIYCKYLIPYVAYLVTFTFISYTRRVVRMELARFLHPISSITTSATNISNVKIKYKKLDVMCCTIRSWRSAAFYLIVTHLVLVSFSVSTFNHDVVISTIPQTC